MPQTGVDDGLFIIRALMEGDVNMDDHVTISVGS